MFLLTLVQEPATPLFFYLSIACPSCRESLPVSLVYTCEFLYIRQRGYSLGHSIALGAWGRLYAVHTPQYFKSPMFGAFIFVYWHNYVLVVCALIGVTRISVSDRIYPTISLVSPEVESTVSEYCPAVADV